jgi:hypothetical protein
MSATTSPTREAYRVNTRQVAWTDMNGCPDALQIVGTKIDGRYYVICGHFTSGGVSILDVTDPAKPEVVHHLPSETPNTWNINVQVAGSTMMIANERIIPGWGPLPPESPWSAGVRFYDIGDPSAPRALGAWSTSGTGTHRNWYVGAQYAYLTTSEEGYNGRFLLILDVSDLEHPKEAGRWWVPGQATKLGETPTWPMDPNHRFHATLHGPIIAGNLAFLAYEDLGLKILDISDPTHPQLVGESNTKPPFAGYTHTTLPLPGRKLVVAAEETIAFNCEEEQKRIWLVDIREPSHPVPFQTLPLPVEPPGAPRWCEKGLRFGPHNLHENRPGAFQTENLVFNAFFNAGLRVWDIRDPFKPREVAAFMAPNPEKAHDFRPGAVPVLSSEDVYIDDRGYCFLTDHSAGLYVVELEGEARELMDLH